LISISLTETLGEIPVVAPHWRRYCLRNRYYCIHLVQKFLNQGRMSELFPGFTTPVMSDSELREIEEVCGSNDTLCSELKAKAFVEKTVDYAQRALSLDVDEGGAGVWIGLGVLLLIVVTGCLFAYFYCFHKVRLVD